MMYAYRPFNGQHVRVRLCDGCHKSDALVADGDKALCGKCAEPRITQLVGPT